MVLTDRLRQRVREHLRTHHLFHADKLLLVAVSGGPDSLCLLHILWWLREEGEGGPLLHVAHLDHSFRGEQSAQEAEFVAQTARAWHIPATVEQYDVPAYVEATGQNKQTAARLVRYEFLARVAQTSGADGIALGHHADDQAETVLLHLLYGAGPSGLRGMQVVSTFPDYADTFQTDSPPPLIRPLLDTSRTEIEEYCGIEELTPQHDPTNAQPLYTRNRIRAELLPHMAQYNPNVVAALGRTARICADDYAYIQQQLDAVWNDELVEEQSAALHFKLRRWRELPATLQRYALRRAVETISGQDDLGYELVEVARAATYQTTGSQQTLAKSLMLQVEYERFIVFDSATTQQKALLSCTEQRLPQLATNELPLVVPGSLTISECWFIESRLMPPPTLPETDDGWLWWTVLDAEKLDGPLLLRWRQPGDRFRPAGGPGSRSLKDFFVDQKIPRVLRTAWPLLATPEHIVWVAGLRVDERFCATDETTQPLWVLLWERDDA